MKLSLSHTAVRTTLGKLCNTMRSSCGSAPDRLIPAMSIGDERGFSAADFDMMAATGLSHLSAVSGANVALVVGAVMGALFWAPAPVRVGAAALTVVAFVAVVGVEPSVLRAVATGLVGLVAVVAGRRSQALAALSGCVVALVLVVPELSISVGFRALGSGYSGPYCHRRATRAALGRALLLMPLALAFGSHAGSSCGCPRCHCTDFGGAPGRVFPFITACELSSSTGRSSGDHCGNTCYHRRCRWTELARQLAHLASRSLCLVGVSHRAILCASASLVLSY